MVKSCFSGIHWKPVYLIVILSALFAMCLTLFRVSAGKPWFELKYLAYIIGGIGVGPLVEYLLNLNTQSDVFMSTILEENQTYVANGIAWQYFIYLKQALPVFKKAASSLNLNKNKLILLIPLDCHTEDDLSKVDNKIFKVKETGRHGDAFRFKLYDLSVGSKKRRFAIQYVKEPLNTLKEMCLMKDGQAVTHDNLNEQVKLFQRTLFDIFNHQLRKVYKEACLFVSFDCEELEFLKNGGLAKVIFDGVENSHDEGDKIDGVPGFFKLERPKQSDNGGKTSKKKKRDSDVSISSSKNKTTLRNRQNSHLSEIVIVSDLDGGDVGQSTKHGVENSDV
ncbi:uncharacterized protein LOC124441376 [Xenia sp. Carnegie-2017]|uniref:uncharacterized protein LOC124441376 n=1 Tax=Xenia sp. Carnegie-2017 TaxID=2897299 RepID=UPI001F04EF3B|nr:uncharacterized protein LOC124441376 [Xenia sp. Carnegie-2017]